MHLILFTEKLCYAIDVIGESSSVGLYWPMEYYDSDTDKMHQYSLAGTNNPIWTTFGKNRYVFNDGGIGDGESETTTAWPMDHTTFEVHSLCMGFTFPMELQNTFTIIF